jgi:hypothetical protein
LRSDNKPVLCYDVFLVDRSINGLFNFYKNPVKTFSFNPNSKNILFTVENDTIYWTSSEVLNSLKIDHGFAEIPMNKAPAKFNSPEEIKSFLSF